MKIGYMRVSTDLDRQSFDLQYDALIKAGVDERNIFKDVQSGASIKRQGLEQALNYMKAGDCLVVWKLDRLGRSLINLLDIVQKLRDKKVGFQSLTEAFDTTTPHGNLCKALHKSPYAKKSIMQSSHIYTFKNKVCESIFFA